MIQKMEDLDKNEAKDFVKFPNGNKFVSSKWAFKNKLNATTKVKKCKTEMVAKGYSQVEGTEFGEIFSHVAKLTSIRFLLSLVVAFDLELEQVDVKRTFLHGTWMKKST